MSIPNDRRQASLIHRLVEGLDLTPDGHVVDLARKTLFFLKTGDAKAAWMLADRLVRLGEGADAQSLMLRGAAFAAMGEPAAARQDFEAAALADPEHRMVNQSRLRSTDPAARERAVRALLRQPGDVDAAMLGAQLLADGFSCLAILAPGSDGVTGRLFWTGDDRVTLAIDDGTTRSRLSVPAQADVEAAPFAHTAPVAFGWPVDATAVSITIENLRALVEPTIVRRVVPAPALPTAVSSSRPAAEPGLMILLPVYDAVEAVTACFESLRRSPPTSLPFRIVAIDDAAPTPGVSAVLDALAEEGRITLLRNPLNLGFAASVNRALALRRPDEDVLLLNADTIVPPGAIDRLRIAALSDAMIGTVTPLSNNGEDTSLPRRFRANPMPSDDEIAALDALASTVNGGGYVDMPNGIGFCLYVKSEVLDRIGPLSLAFGRGYYEDVEFCLKAAAEGFRNVCATDVYVGHHGSFSFKSEKRALVRRNLPLLARSHPDYRHQSQQFVLADPLKPAIGRLEQAWLAQGPEFDLLVTPPLPAALREHIAASLTDTDRRLVVATVSPDGDGFAVNLSAPDGGFPQNAGCRSAPGEGSAPDRVFELERYFRDLKPRRVMAVDPHSLPGPVETALRRLGWLETVVLAEVPLSQASGRNILAADLIAPTERMAQLIETILPGPAVHRLPSPRRSMAPRRSGEGFLAVLQPMPDADALTRHDALLSELRRRNTGHGLCLLEEPPDALTLMAGHPVFATGEIPDDDLDGWLARSGAGALFLNTTRFGLGDPRLEAWLSAGLPVAILAPDGQDSDARLLRLNPSDPVDQIARRLWDWVEGFTHA
ncbi:glycosyltransferase family 2 protein [Bosea sp. PAMC 26642]|uniref:glycosyltransferase family 2 protein n=1 Tax=Bosea sp. (strain PAMC 26642) TaxID=1792307 RepID=UPI0007705497|nr:glycosyltransferase family 2 protein [Bosea sp. PAMC 26642]AMJ61170.1 hypothetical protein AXW83_13475 [Bosea sp. PAMC 26642]